MEGERILMVSMELLMSLFALLYAFPHVPSRLIEPLDDEDDRGGTYWKAVTDHASLRDAAMRLLHVSPVLRVCLPRGHALAVDLTPDVLGDADRLDECLGLGLYADGVPVAAQQMVHAICGVYASLFQPPLDPSAAALGRDWVLALLTHHGILAPGVVVSPKAQADQSGLLAFGSHHTVAWLQPYFASDPLFYHPSARAAVCPASH